MNESYWVAGPRGGRDIPDRRQEVVGLGLGLGVGTGISKEMETSIITGG